MAGISYMSQNERQIRQSRPQNRIDVEVFGSFDELTVKQEEWDSFVESSTGCIFLTYDWCRIWWKHYAANRTLRVFIFRLEGTLIGIMPMFLENILLGPSVLRIAKIVGTDFTPITVSLPIETKFLPEVLKAFLEQLMSDYGCDIVHIGPLAGLFDGSERVATLCEEILGKSYKIECAKNGVQTYFPLADSWEAQLASLSKNGRRHITRNYNALHRMFKDRQGGLVSDFSANTNFHETFDGFVEMHQRHWRKLGKGGHFGDWPNALEFHREVAQAQLTIGRLRLLEIKMSGYCLGYEYAFKFGNEYFAFLNSRFESGEFATVGVGHILFGEQMKKAIAENVRYINAMQGQYEHKSRLGGTLFPIRNIYCSQRGLLFSVRIRVFQGLCWLLNMCYYKIWFLKIAPKLPMKRRPLWRIWIRCRMFSKISWIHQ